MPLFDRFTSAAFRHRRLVVLGWVVAIAALTVVAGRAGGQYATNFRFPDSQSQRASDLLAERFPARAGDTVTVAFQAPDGVRDPAVRQRMTALFTALAGREHVASVRSPYDPPPPNAAAGAGAAPISADGTIALATVQLDTQSQNVPVEVAEQFVDDARATAAADGPGGLQVALSGQAILAAEGPGGDPSGAVGFVAAVVVLLVAFGSLLAMGLPLVTALFGLGTGLAVLSLGTRLLDIPNWAPSLAGLLALGVGVDYALFIVTRYREALASGLEPAPAAARAMATAGRSVLFAGTVVVISVLGIFTMGFPILNGLAVGAAVSVATTLLAALTLLPALLGFTGRRIDALALPWVRRRAARAAEAAARPEAATSGSPSPDVTTAAASSGWAAWARLVQRRPWAFATGGILVLLLLAAPVLDLRLGFPDDGNNPRTSTTRQAYDLIRDGFGPGVNAPLLLAAELSGPAAEPGAATGRLAALARQVAAVPGVASVTPAQVNPQGTAAVISVVPTTGPQDAATGELVQTLRDRLPGLTAGTGVDVAVGGLQAATIDLTDAIASRLPLFVGVVVGLSFLLLVLVFRSVLVPLKAAVLNLLSVGAAYGVVVAVFQWGWGQSVLGLEGTVPIPVFILMLMFAVLFGLSMDYEVFLLSRIREEHARSGDTRAAVTRGLASTARVITAAAAIMASVFGAFVLNDVLFLQLFGVGLAAAVVIDATLIRLVVVPAVMELLGDANWWLPRGLARVLPILSVDGMPEPDDSEAGGSSAAGTAAPVPAV